MVTCFLPLKTAFNASSALICVLFLESCSPFFLMYSQSFLVRAPRGSGLEPTITDSFSSGCTGFISAGFAFRLAGAALAAFAGLAAFADFALVVDFDVLVDLEGFAMCVA